MFTPTVTKPERLGPAPDDVEKKSHHAKKDGAGRPTKFANPHDSFAPPDLSLVFPSLLYVIVPKRLYILEQEHVTNSII